jgi:glucose/mannose-6-phosphate isomerase
VNEHTLVIASSYSGTTEETIAATEDAFKKGAKVAGITSGGKLAELLKAHNAPALVFEPKYNPCNQPRMALGYSIFGQIALFARAGVLSVTAEDYKAVLAAIADAHLQYSVALSQETNLAKILAFEMKERIPVIVTAEHLEGAGHVFANQLNENAKNYSEFRVIPELNHHLMEGLQFPKLNDSTFVFVMIDSPLYSSSNRRRLELTEQVLDKNHITFQRVTLKGKTKLEQVFELLTFGAYANFYLAMLNNINPAPIPWVDWFKSQLKK